MAEPWFGHSQMFACLAHTSVSLLVWVWVSVSTMESLKWEGKQAFVGPGVGFVNSDITEILVWENQWLL